MLALLLEVTQSVFSLLTKRFSIACAGGICAFSFSAFEILRFDRYFLANLGVAAS